MPRLSLRTWVIIGAFVALILCYFFCGFEWAGRKAAEGLRAVLDKTDARFQTEIAARDKLIKANEEKADAYRQAAQDARRRGDMLAVRAQTVRPAQTNRELKERYEKLGYHPVFR